MLEQFKVKDSKECKECPYCTSNKIVIVLEIKNQPIDYKCECCGQFFEYDPKPRVGFVSEEDRGYS